MTAILLMLAVASLCVSYFAGERGVFALLRGSAVSLSESVQTMDP